MAEPAKPTCIRCHKRKASRIGPFCSNRCAGKYGLETALFTHDRCRCCGQYVQVKHPLFSGACPTCGEKFGR